MAAVRGSAPFYFCLYSGARYPAKGYPRRYPLESRAQAFKSLANYSSYTRHTVRVLRMFKVISNRRGRAAELAIGMFRSAKPACKQAISIRWGSLELPEKNEYYTV